MGTYKQGILGSFIGKVGTVVGSTWRGLAVMRSLASKVANPRTAAQVAVRNRLAAVSKTLRPFLETIRRGFIASGTAPSWSLAIKVNREDPPRRPRCLHPPPRGYRPLQRHRQLPRHRHSQRNRPLPLVGRSRGDRRSLRCQHPSSRPQRHQRQGCQLLRCLFRRRVITLHLLRHHGK